MKYLVIIVQLHLLLCIDCTDQLLKVLNFSETQANYTKVQNDASDREQEDDGPSAVCDKSTEDTPSQFEEAAADTTCN